MSTELIREGAVGDPAFEPSEPGHSFALPEPAAHVWVVPDPEADLRRLGLIGAAAQTYHEMGLSIFPMYSGTKQPNVRRWKHLQERRPTGAEIARWFHRRVQGIALVLGPVSGGIYARDFDTDNAYRHWSRTNCAEAAVLPTFRTGRGRVVLFRSTPNFRIHNFRNSHPGDPSMEGELRGEAHYVLLPPSWHHSGRRYCWEIPLPDRLAEVSEADPVVLFGLPTPLSTSQTHAVGSECRSEREAEGSSRDSSRHNQADDSRSTLLSISQTHAVSSEYGSEGVGRGRKTGSDGRKDDSPERRVGKGAGAAGVREATSPDSDDGIDKGIWERFGEMVRSQVRASLPEVPGERNRNVFGLWRRMMGIPFLADAGIEDLKPLVRYWHATGVRQGVIGTVEFEPTWKDFLAARRNAKVPMGFEGLRTVRDAAAAKPPPAGVADCDDRTILVAKICRELAGPERGSFFLGVRTAAKLAGTYKERVADHILPDLQRLGQIRLIRKGDYKTGKASIWKYTGD